MKKPGKIVFNPASQPGYQSRAKAFTFNSLFGDAQFGLQSGRAKKAQAIELPQGLKSFQLPQVFPSRRRMK